MGWRFRRSIKIAPGIRWNVNTRGSSWSFGRRGYTVNVSSRGVRRTVSIPGTGLSHSSFRGTRRAPARRLHVITSQVAPAPLTPPPRPTRRSPPHLFRADPSTIAPLDDAAAITVTKQWAERQASTLGRFIVGGITHIDYDDVDRYLASYTIESRTIVVRTEALARKVKPSGVLANLRGFDPWAPDIGERLTSTRTIATCPTCGGEGRHQCPACAGLGDLLCDACGATGSVMSDRSGKMIKCRSCGGDGRRRCPCRDGMISCTSCNGKGVATAWLEVERTTRVVTKRDGDSQFLANVAIEEIAANVERIGGAQGTRTHWGHQRWRCRSSGASGRTRSTIRAGNAPGGQPRAEHSCRGPLHARGPRGEAEHPGVEWRHQE